ncbi:ABC-type transport auxiliary lipoprotein family protein [Pseudomonas sp. Pseusp122]|uniref:ABC-type transport auxiliary lipoprotein family protein n=1 Tax=unclassified Pseudomonas TaxID=196821 RepID=UPI0039A51DC1
MTGLKTVVGRCLIAGAMALSSACSILPPAEPMDVYQLRGGPYSRLTGNNELVRWSLRIDRPKASEALDSPRIAVVPQDNMISSYKGARWSDAGPLMLRNQIRDLFVTDHRIQAVSTDDNNLQADFELNGDLLAFQSEYRGSAIEVVIRYDARLVDDRQRIVASRRFEVRQPAKGKEVPAVVTAFDAASNELAWQVLDWTLQEGRKHYVALPKTP